MGAGIDWDLYRALVEDALGVVVGEEPPTWRALFHPTFHVDASVTIRGDELVLRWLAPHVRGLLLGEVGMRGGGSAHTPVVGAEWLERRCTIPRERLAKLEKALARIDPATLEEDMEAARDGIQLVGQAGEHEFHASSPTREHGPRYHGFFTLLLHLARESFGEEPVIVDLLGYFR